MHLSQVPSSWISTLVSTRPPFFNPLVLEMASMTEKPGKADMICLVAYFGYEGVFYPASSILAVHLISFLKLLFLWSLPPLCLIKSLA